MKDWELDKIYIWVRAASIADNKNGVKFLIDQNDRSLFNLILKDKKWKCILNQEIGVRYTKTHIKILEKKIESLDNNQGNILEFPKLNNSKIDYIQKAKSELENKIRNRVEYDTMEYNRIIYEEPADF